MKLLPLLGHLLPSVTARCCCCLVRHNPSEPIALLALQLLPLLLQHPLLLLLVVG